MAIEFLHSLDVSGDLQVDGAIKDSEGVDKSSNWNKAYSWGDHASAGYLTSAENFYTQGVTFDTSNGVLTINVKGATNRTVDLDGRYLVKTWQGGDDYFAGHHSEGRTIVNAYLANDLANLRLRGGSVTATNTSFTDAEVDKMFDGTAAFTGIPTSDFDKAPVVIEVVIPRVLRYGAYVGIGFGNSTWRCKKVKIEAHSNGAWVTCIDLTNNAHEDVYTNIPGNSAGGTDKFRITLDDPNNNVRVCHIWAYNYDSRLWSETMMPRAGGTMYGALTVNGTLNSHTIPSGSGTIALTSDIPSTPTDFVSKANGGAFGGDISVAGNLILTGSSNEIIKSNGSIRLNIDSDSNQTDRIFIVSTGSNSELFRVDESGNGTFQGILSATGYNSDNWDKAYGWGDHASAGYGSSSFDGKYTSLTDVPTSFTPSVHNHDGRYLKLNARLKANADTINQSGIHIWDVSESTDKPTGASDGLLTTKYWDSGDWAVQMYEDFHQREIHIRNKRSGAWQSDWAQVHTTDNFSTSDVSKGVTAHGWGNHANGGYLKSYTESSTLEDVRNRGNGISGVINFTPDTGDILQVDGQVILKRTTANGGITIGHDDSIIIAGGDSSGTLNDNINNANETVYIGAEGGMEVYAFPDNLTGGWNARKTWKFSNTGDTTFPGKLYPTAQSTHFVNSTRIQNWQTAYGWGDHASAGYIKSVTNVSGYSGTLLRSDNRVISPSEETAGRLKFGFTSWTNDNKAPYADFLHLRSYTDSSGGNDNLVMFKKGGIGMRIWQQGFGSTDAYSNYVDVWTTGDFNSTTKSNWDTAYGWGDHAAAGYVSRSKPTKPAITSKIVNDTIEVTITASTTSNIDQYLVFSSVVGSDFGLISVIPPEDFSATMSIIDSSFDLEGKIDYRVYAVKNGVYSDASTTSQTYDAGTLEPTNVSVIPMNEAFYVQWDEPSSNTRFVKNYKLYHDSHDVEGSLGRNNATLIYSGKRLSHMIASSDSKFNKFWVEIEVS